LPFDYEGNGYLLALQFKVRDARVDYGVLLQSR